jgi:protease-4
MAAARKRAGVADTTELEVSIYGDAGGLFSSLGGEPGVLADVLPEGLLPTAPPLLPEGVRTLAREAGLDAPGLLEPGMKAQLPFSVTVR